MKISCQSCAAKYTIADEKVVGKVIKIKCKKCSATIVVNGNDPAALAAQVAAEAASFDDNAATQLFGQGGAGEAPNPDEWTVSVTDEDQRTMTTQQVVEAYQQGLITGDNYIWKDGMGDWQPLAEVAELAAHLGGAGAGANGNGAAAAYAAVAQPGGFAPGGGLAYETTAAMASPQMPAPQAAAPVAAAPVAARKAGARGGVDLFGSRSEPRDAAAAAAQSAAHNIGERNESSVLFSLASLNAAEEAAKKSDFKAPTTTNDRVDDILSLGGGMGMGGPMLAPPPMNAPIIEAPPPPPPMSVAPASYAPQAMGQMPYQMQPQKKASPVGFIVGGVGALAAVGMLIFFLTRGSSDKAPATDSTSKTADTAKAEDTSKPTAVAMNDTAKPADTGKPAEAAATDTSKPADTGKPAETAKPDDKAVKDFKSAVDAKNPSGTPTPASKDPPKKEEPKKEEPKKEDPPPAAGGGGEFDRGAASAQLSAKAGGASGCKKPDGPTGSAKVQVTFAPSGKVTQATVGAPFAGTPVGSCIASLFKGASVPPFSGGAMTVSKTVSIK